MKFLKKIDLYILRYYLGTFFFMVLLLALVALVIDFSEKIESNALEPNTTITDFYLFNKKVNVNQYDKGEQDSPLKKSIALTDSIFLQPLIGASSYFQK